MEKIMEILPVHSLGLGNAWWFALVYGLLSFGIMAFMPKERRKRILTFPTYQSKSEKIISGISIFIFGKGLIIYSFIVPVKLFTPWFFIGIPIYFLGMICSVYAMWSFSKADLKHPVTEGIYKISRHPMQVMNIVMWIGIGIIAGNWIVLVLSFLYCFVSNKVFKIQERFCTENYGEAYLTYIKKTPRYLLF